MDHLVGVGTADVAAVHPPAVQLSVALGNVSVPGRPQPVQLSAPTSLECVPAPTFGQLGQVCPAAALAPLRASSARKHTRARERCLLPTRFAQHVFPWTVVVGVPDFILQYHSAHDT